MGAEGERPLDLPEDSPLVKQLKEIDDKYLELQREYERECQRLLLQYSERQQPLLEERRKILTAAAEGSGSSTGTPALSGFWLTAMQNHPAVCEVIQEWDEHVLEHLSDVEKSNVDDTDANRGFKLVFHFTENPYFSNTEIWKEYTTELTNPYCGEIEVKEIKCSKIDWKSGKDVTVEKVARKMKGQKKSKQKGHKEEPRASFFRDFFRNLHKETKLEDDAREQAMAYAMDEGDDDDENLLMYLMESDHDIGMALRDNVVPFAVRWYTGEASPDLDDDDDDSDEEEEEEEEEEDPDEDVEDEEESPPKAQGRSPKAVSKAAPRKQGKGGKKSSPEAKSSDGPNKEECKQQ